MSSHEYVTAHRRGILHDSHEGTGVGSTTLILVEVEASGSVGMGYSYAEPAAAEVVRQKLAPVVRPLDAMDIPHAWEAMVRAVRNMGRPGIASMAISAVDNALWDLKAKLLDLPVFKLLGSVRQQIAIYGSGGFTSYEDHKLTEQLGGWVAAGIPRVKMKVGRDPRRDFQRVRAARLAIGTDAELFVDANSAYTRKQALDYVRRFEEEANVTWMEQPLEPNDLEGLCFLRDHSRLVITDGEYCYEPADFRRFLESGSVDVMMADATRCGGITGFMMAADICEAFDMPMSAHCAPSLHAQVGCAAVPLRHIEYFHDHVRIEHALFDGALAPAEGALRPDPSRPGLGLEFKRSDAERMAKSN